MMGTDLAVSEKFGLVFLLASFQYEPYHLGSIKRPLIFGNSHSCVLNLREGHYMAPRDALTYPCYTEYQTGSHRRDPDRNKNKGPQQGPMAKQKDADTAPDIVQSDKGFQITHRAFWLISFCCGLDGPFLQTEVVSSHCASVGLDRVFC